MRNGRSQTDTQCTHWGNEATVRLGSWDFPSWFSGLRTRLVSLRMQVRSLASLSGLRILRYRELWCEVTDVTQIWHDCRCGCGSNSTPSLGTSICCRCSLTRKKKQKQAAGLRTRVWGRLFTVWNCFHVNHCDWPPKP